MSAARDPCLELHLPEENNSQLLSPSRKFTSQAERKQTANEGIWKTDELRPESPDAKTKRSQLQTVFLTQDHTLWNSMQLTVTHKSEETFPPSLHKADCSALGSMISENGGTDPSTDLPPYIYLPLYIYNPLIPTSQTPLWVFCSITYSMGYIALSLPRFLRFEPMLYQSSHKIS